MNNILLIFLIFILSLNAFAAGGNMKFSSNELCIKSQEKGISLEAAKLLAKTIKNRTGMDIPINPKDSYKTSILIGTSKDGISDYILEDTENEGFAIKTSTSNIIIASKTEKGLMAGTGKFLRIIDFYDNKLNIPETNIISNPKMPVRGMYFASHFRNFYECAPLPVIDEVLEDLALWGCNSIMVWFDMHQYNGFNDPAAQDFLKKLQHIQKTSNRLGMKFGLTCLGNEGYANSPVEYRVTATNPGNYGVEMCPSIPEALEIISDNLAQVAASFENVDTFWIWPYDQGGCWCEKCLPYGGNGFVKAIKAISPKYKKLYPNAEIWVSTWKMDYFREDEGEIKGLNNFLGEKESSYVTGIITGQDQYNLQKELDNRPTPQRFPLVSFPEISMYGMFPWGGFGASPLVNFNRNVFNLMKDKIIGGWPYSEGIYEDISKFQWIQMYWDPSKSDADILKEYSDYYFGKGYSDEITELIYLMEEMHERSNWSFSKDLSKAPRMKEIVDNIDSKLPNWSKKSWRFKLLYCRAAIDDIVNSHDIRNTDTHKLLKKYCDEITDICYTHKTHLKPPEFPAAADSENIAYRKKATVSSSMPGYENREKHITDNNIASDSMENFWVNDPTKEKTSWVIIDMENETEIKEIKLGYRLIENIYRFIPQNVSFEISIDGQTFEPFTIVAYHPENTLAPAGPFVVTTMTPTENSKGDNSHLWTYKISEGGKKGRFLKINLGESQCQTDPYKGLLELTEVMVYKN